jgi:RNA polymerase sigma factor (sigma-70 family)
MSHDWREIQDSHGPRVWAIVYRILKNDAEALDCYQEVFLETFQRTEQNSVKNMPGLLCWLAAHRAIDRLRQRKRENGRFVVLRNVSLVPSDNPEPIKSVVLNELMETVRHELSNLPEKQAEVFWLRCIEQMSYDEIAYQIGSDANTVGVLIHRAKMRLQKKLADLYPNPKAE